jgi:hypothetical protein
MNHTMIAWEFARCMNDWPEGCDREYQTVVDMAYQFADRLAVLKPEGYDRKAFLVACGIPNPFTPEGRPYD